MIRLLFLFFGLCAIESYGQVNFLLVEETNRQPFYIRMGEVSYSSSSAGHLLLSGLRDSSYNMYIGFPRTRYPEQLFNVEMKGRDRGLELRKEGAGWRLLDLQNGVFISPLRSNIYSPGGARKEDPYSKLMAGVVNDTAVLYSTIVNVAPADTGVAVAAADTTAVRKAADVPVPAGAVSEGRVYDKRDIVRYGTENVLEGKLMIYLDRSAPVTDTIRLVIPR